MRVDKRVISGGAKFAFIRWSVSVPIGALFFMYLNIEVVKCTL